MHIRCDSVVLNPGGFVPSTQGAPFGLSRLEAEGCYWNLAGIHQGCCWTSYDARDSLPNLNEECQRCPGKETLSFYLIQWHTFKSNQTMACLFSALIQIFGQPAWLSLPEFVMPRNAEIFPGVRFLERSEIPLFCRNVFAHSWTINWSSSATQTT